jgi:hypothetical protein
MAPSPYWGDERIWDTKANNHNGMFDGKGRVWFAATVRGPRNLSFCEKGSDHPSAKLFPMERANRHLTVLEPKTMKYTFIDTCFQTHHLQFGYDANDTLWTSGGGPVVGWVNTKLFDETGDAARAGEPGSVGDGHDFDLDQQIGVREAAHFDRGAGGQRGPEVLQADVDMTEELVDVGHERRHLHDVGQAGPGRGQGDLDVLAHLPDLGAHVALAHHVAVDVARELAGQEDQPPALHRDHVRVDRLAARHARGDSRGLDVLSLHWCHRSRLLVAPVRCPSRR